MKAIVLSKPYEFSLQYLPTPIINDNEILIKIAYCAICATDIRILEGKKIQDISYPCIIGHEISGTISQVGCNIKHLHTGESVNIAPIIPCNKCKCCLSGRENICLHRTAFGYQLSGGYAEYIRITYEGIKNNNITKLTNNISLKDGTLIEPLACCINGITKANLQPTDTVLIVGAGTIGQIHLMLCRLHNVHLILVSDPSSLRRKKAKESGADITIDPTQDNIHIIMQKYKIQSFDKIIIACAANTAVGEAIKLCSTGGRIILFSGFAKTDSYAINLNYIHYKEIEIIGSRGYTRNNYLSAITLMDSKKINLTSLISAVYSIEDFLQAYNQQKSGNHFKILIKP
ncbi:alcohol dehydrogenase catalytic domain-containing protein [Pectinatus frisingensis]|uniref:alcohol dehydrogenase catalytic domain-containing protein n=1 Tax=Pectinatus frisingensis TaxID=865 RepID=UPI0015F4EC94|nr:alcohol dehydrogenase catalytic domain-containing protein [Pectinatus frisingensis]